MVLTRTLTALPDLLDLHCLHPDRYPFLLESVASGSDTARYSLLLGFPQDRLLAVSGEDFLARLDHWWQSLRLPASDSALPFRGGWFFYLGYELAAQVEPVLELPATPGGLPMACAVRVPAAVVLDHHQGRAWLMAEAGYADLLDTMAGDVASLPDRPAGEPDTVLQGTVEEDDPARFLASVARVRRYIRDGDVFQVNLSRAWRGRLAAGVEPVHLYRRLRRRNPAPFAGLARLEGATIISSSPERLVRVRGDGVDTRPIAGTRPRGRGRESDQGLSRELLAHPKERAEHVMLIDLERNDLGRVCRAGTVRVDELMVLESYAHVHHIVSNVQGRLRPDITPGQVLRAVFPGGTITGCPKVRCMEIIAEQEGVGRGAYTGSMGYLNRDGDLDCNILIRTLVQREDTVSFRAGGGIVADSEPHRELDETRAKARGLLLALEGR